MNDNATENTAARVPLYLDSLDQRLDVLMGTLRDLCTAIAPVLSETEPSDVEVAMPAQDKGLSSVASRLSHMDDQVHRMVLEVEYISSRVEL